MPISTIGTAGLAASTTLTTPTLASANITTALTLTGASGTNGQVLTSAGSGSAPTWTTISSTPTAITNGTSNVTVNGSGGDVTATTNGTTAVTIDTSQRVGIAGNANGNFNSQASFFNPGSNNFCAEFNTAANSNIVLWQRTNTYPCTQIQFYGFNGAVATNAGSITLSGSTSTSYNTSSDYRMKENVQPMTNGLSKVALLKPVTYKWKEEFGGKDGQGFIAHELQEVIPEAVTWEKDAIDEKGDPRYQGMDTSYLVATLTAAIQELKAIVDAQAAEIAELKTRLTP